MRFLSSDLLLEVHNASVLSFLTNSLGSFMTGRGIMASLFCLVYFWALHQVSIAGGCHGLQNTEDSVSYNTTNLYCARGRSLLRVPGTKWRSSSTKSPVLNVLWAENLSWGWFEAFALSFFSRILCSDTICVLTQAASVMCCTNSKWFLYTWAR